MTGQRPEPSLITMALDKAGLFGDAADAKLGVLPPTVDLWESGALVPTDAQLALLAELAHLPVAFFYGPPMQPVTGFVCYRTKKAAGGPSRCVRTTYPEPPHDPADDGRLF